MTAVSSPAETSAADIARKLADFTANPALADYSATAALSDVLDSLSHFSFLMHVEKSMMIEFPDEHFNMDEMGTIAGIVEVVRRSAPAGGAAHPA